MSVSYVLRLRTIEIKIKSLSINSWTCVKGTTRDENWFGFISFCLSWNSNPCVPNERKLCTWVKYAMTYYDFFCLFLLILFSCCFSHAFNLCFYSAEMKSPAELFVDSVALKSHNVHQHLGDNKKLYYNIIICLNSWLKKIYQQ